MIEATSTVRLKRSEESAALLREALRQAAVELGVKPREDWGDGQLCFAVLYRLSRLTPKAEAELVGVER